MLQLTLSFPLPAKAGEKILCATTEINIASCETTTGEYVSICAHRGGNAYYRFGSRSKNEQDFEFSKDKQIFRWLDSNTYITFFGFDHGNLSYVFGVPQETLGATAFLVVREKRERFTYNETFTCTSNSFGDKKFKSQAVLDIDDDLVRCGDEIIFPPLENADQSRAVALCDEKTIQAR